MSKPFGFTTAQTVATGRGMVHEERCMVSDFPATDREVECNIPVFSFPPSIAVVGWINEDELPEGYPYDAMFPHSRVDGVRLFPVFTPAEPQPPGYETGEHGFIGTREQLANALYECGERNGATASAVCKTAADLIRAVQEPGIEARAYGPYKVTFLGPAVWAGITDELPPELAGEKVWLTTAPPQDNQMTAGMVAFIRACVEDAWDGGSMDGGSIQEIAVKHGILKQVSFDPTAHSDPDACAEPGDPWFVYTSAFKDISGAMK